ncbi:MAG: hypothetical protein GOMPHAMPRED_002353 [Gomphillus americanus]|uniref:Uncharacterized protein n=1 Tax=Gomphillus americanus TaxID=1940652 RepID=A0A8H3FGS6_9LECA|nr:MAG: hypothetical protein GOMPHAMPRED_002353 [Gomphillus americanus]
MDSTRQGSIYNNTSDLQNGSYDVLCIGSGWAGRSLAAKVAREGLTALVVDEDLIGGECPFYACIPSKALLRSSEALDAAFAVDGAKQRITNPKVDVAAVFQRRDMLVSNYDDNQVLVPMVLKSGVDLLRGRGKLAGEKKVEVTSADGKSIILEARTAVALCTGSSPKIPDIPGLAQCNPWSPRDATGAKHAPETLLILGAGVAGCEMATAYTHFGTKVILVGSSDRILPKVEKKAGDIVKQALQNQHVEVLPETKLTNVERVDSDTINVKTSTGQSFQVSQILVAAGRHANTKGIGLEAVNLPGDGSLINVDDSLLVQGVPGKWLYALGDINGRAPLTHMCKYHGRIAASAILKNLGKEAPLAHSAAIADHHATPSVVFTWPQVATVGLTQDEAARKGIKAKFIESSLFTVGSLIHGIPPDEGWASWVIDEESQRLLGMTLVGRDVGEIIHAATVAIVGGLTLQQLAHAIPSFPTISEVFLNLLESAGF